MLSYHIIYTFLRTTAFLIRPSQNVPGFAANYYNEISSQEKKALIDTDSLAPSANKVEKNAVQK